MDGIHDLGGQSGHSTLGYHRNEPVFKDRWEATVFTMVRASAQAGAYTNIDQFRHAVERIDPKAYLEHGYYGRWLGAVETLFVEAGILTTAEITERAAHLGAGPDDLIAARPSRTKIQATGIPAKRNPVGDPPWFKVGDPVHTVQSIAPRSYPAARLRSEQRRLNHGVPGAMALSRSPSPRSWRAITIPLHGYFQ